MSLRARGSKRNARPQGAGARENVDEPVAPTLTEGISINLFKTIIGLGERMDDLLIRGATVIDGTGGAPRSADVAICGGRISAVEARRSDTPSRENDRAGRDLAPGLIDIHTHSDFTLPLNPLAEAKV